MFLNQTQGRVGEVLATYAEPELSVYQNIARFTREGPSFHNACLDMRAWPSYAGSSTGESTVNGPWFEYSRDIYEGVGVIYGRVASPIEQVTSGGQLHR